jgi:HK97 family phage portal protein
MDWFKRREAKTSAARPLIALSQIGRPIWNARDPRTFAREGVQKNAVAYRCVRLIAEAVASVPLKVESKTADHPLAQLLAAPNPEQSGTELIEALIGHLQTSGNGYLEAVTLEDRPRELYALRPDRMRALPGRNGWPMGWEYRVGGASVKLLRAPDGTSPVMQLRLFHPADDYYGLSPLEAAGLAVDIHNAAADWAKALIDNAARPSGALVYGREGSQLTEDQFERLKGELEGLHTGPSNAGRPLLLEGGLDWKPMSLTPAEMDFSQTRHAAAREIALAFGVPPMLLGIPGDNTYATYREANLAFWRLVVCPLAEKTADSLTRWLAPRFKEPAIVRADLNAVTALATERDAIWARAEAASFLTPDERRAMVGLALMAASPADGGRDAD